MHCQGEDKCKKDHDPFKLFEPDPSVKVKAVAILPSTAIYPQRLFCRELFVIGQS